MLALFFATVASAQTQVPSNSRLKTIASAKVVKIAYRTDARPFSFVNNNQPVGYSIDLCKLVVTSIERQLNSGSLKIEWVPVTLHISQRWRAGKPIWNAARARDLGPDERS